MSINLTTAFRGTPCLATRREGVRSSARVPFVPRHHARPHPASRAVRVAATAAVADVQELNTKFGKPGAVELKEGRGGLPTVVLKHPVGSSAEVTLFGGCVTSWKTSGGTEVLYIRPDAVFDKSKPISGGIPHCFPQFGPGAIQLHGFARNLDWQLVGASGDGKPQVQLQLTDSDKTKSLWPHAFKAVYTVTLEGDQLVTELQVHNTCKQAFDFTASLHSYFGVADIETTAVQGLKGLEYLDRVADAKHPSVHKELRELVTFSGPVDAVYRGAKGAVRLDNGKGTVTLSSSNWPDVVVWTPWTAMQACYKEFVCVENAQFGSVKLAPGESWTAKTTFGFVEDPLEKFCGENPDDPQCIVYDD